MVRLKALVALPSLSQVLSARHGAIAVTTFVSLVSELDAWQLWSETKGLCDLINTVMHAQGQSCESDEGWG